jgi:hypothetical protein
MKSILTAGTFLALAFAIPAWADAKIKIDTVPATYTPSNYNRSERVRVSSYHFEVNEELGRARVIVIYTYRDQITYATDDAKGGPKPTTVEVPGLTYDAKTHAVVYDSGGTKAVCATVPDKGGATGHPQEAKNTGGCTVTAVVGEHVDDKAWETNPHAALDIFLNVH